MAGAEKSPGGNERARCVRRLARAIRCANRAGANARGRAQARTQDTRAKTVPPLAGAQAGGGGRNGAERNAREERYAGTERRSFGDGMGNMTIHDTMQGSFHEPPRERAERARGAAPAGEGGHCSAMTGVFTHDKSESDCPGRAPPGLDTGHGRRLFIDRFTGSGSVGPGFRQYARGFVRMASESPARRKVDLLVIGGGINGAGIARDAAGRGLDVLLCERDDLGAHTSSASTKLIHGGCATWSSTTSASFAIRSASARCSCATPRISSGRCVSCSRTMPACAPGG